MTSILDILLRLVVWLLLAPLLPGVINKVKAWVAGRRGPPVVDPAGTYETVVSLNEPDTGLDVHGQRRRSYPRVSWIGRHNVVRSSQVVKSASGPVGLASLRECCEDIQHSIPTVR
jgi:hypothetical protein